MPSVPRRSTQIPLRPRSSCQQTGSVSDGPGNRPTRRRVACSHGAPDWRQYPVADVPGRQFEPAEGPRQQPSRPGLWCTVTGAANIRVCGRSGQATYHRTRSPHSSASCEPSASLERHGSRNRSRGCSPEVQGPCGPRYVQATLDVGTHPWCVLIGFAVSPGFAPPQLGRRSVTTRSAT